MDHRGHAPGDGEPRIWFSVCAFFLKLQQEISGQDGEEGQQSDPDRPASLPGAGGDNFIFNFFTPLRELFGAYALGFEFPELRTTFGFIMPAETGKKINLFLHPGTIIMISGLLSFLFLKTRAYLKGGELFEIIKDSFNNSRNTSIAIFSLVGTAVVMNHAQMTNLLAAGISSIINREIYPIIAPFIGALGAFITGSNNNSNVLFGNLQMQTAIFLDLSVALILASQTAGGALGSIMAPAKVILGCSTVGLGGKEGDVIGKLVLYTSALILSVGVITYIISKII